MDMVLQKQVELLRMKPCMQVWKLRSAVAFALVSGGEKVTRFSSWIVQIWDILQATSRFQEERLQLGRHR